MTFAAGPAISAGRFLALRLAPGADIVPALQAALHRSDARAMAVVTCVGSLIRVRLRHADRDAGTDHEGRFEITSLAGTVSPEGAHLHLAMADGEGRATGGHLLPGAAIYTTAEIVAVLLDDLAFGRAPCPSSGYGELTIEAR
jgi:predicted DNA-binding protein with PD1-like motif